MQEISIEELKDAVAVGKQWFNDSTPQDRSYNYWRLFRALLNLTSELMESGKPDECYFDYRELGKWIENNCEEVSASSVESKTLAGHQKQLERALVEHQAGLERIAKQLDLEVIPRVEARKGGGQSKRSEVFIRAEKIGKSDIPEISEAGVSARDLNNKDIAYYLEATPDLPWWARWFSSVDFGDSIGKRLVWILFVALPFFLVGIIAIHFLLILNGMVMPQWWLGVVFTGFPVYVLMHFVLFRHLIHVVNNNIAMIPNWMLPLRLNSAVLQIGLRKPGEQGYRIKKLSVNVYMADCPVCGHKVYLKSGRLRYWGRIIGVCDANPIEHKFSFDYMTCSGRHLL